jgi:hypothetical protein
VNDEEASDDGDEVFEEGGGEIVAECFGEASAYCRSAEGTDYGSDGTEEQAADEGFMREAESCSAEGSADDAGDELGRNFSAGGVGQLVVDDFAEGKEGEDIRGGGVTEEGQVGAGEIDPTEACSPTDYGRGSHGTEASYDSDQESEYEDGHEVLLVFLSGVASIAPK